MEEPGQLNDGTRLNYAAGLEINRYRGLRVVEHAGEDAGYKAHLGRFPDQHFATALLCNVGNIAPATLTRKIADIYLSNAFTSDATHPVAALTPQPGEQELASRAGVYLERDAGDRIFVVSLNGGKLQGSVGLYGKGSAMAAIGGGRFGYPDFPRTEVAFQEGGSDENAIEVTTYMDGRKAHHYVRVPPFKPTDSELEQYVGTYRGEEVDVFYDVTVKNHQLSVHSLKSSDMTLMPVTSDLFDGGVGRIRFTRNGAGAVSGALVSTHRVYDFRLERTH
jgi:hypothetical protein